MPAFKVGIFNDDKERGVDTGISAEEIEKLHKKPAPLTPEAGFKSLKNLYLHFH
jgi:hypothetical protein